MADKIREEFEAWAIADAQTTDKTLKFERVDEWYLGPDHQVMNLGWAVWQASRDAIVVEMPRVFPGETVSRVCAKHSEAIKAAGVRVKP